MVEEKSGLRVLDVWVTLLILGDRLRNHVGLN